MWGSRYIKRNFSLGTDGDISQKSVCTPCLKTGAPYCETGELATCLHVRCILVRCGRLWSGVDQEIKLCYIYFGFFIFGCNNLYVILLLSSYFNTQFFLPQSRHLSYLEKRFFFCGGGRGDNCWLLTVPVLHFAGITGWIWKRKLLCGLHTRVYNDAVN